jgi:hypothetical protein
MNDVATRRRARASGEQPADVFGGVRDHGDLARVGRLKPTVDSTVKARASLAPATRARPPFGTSPLGADPCSAKRTEHVRASR